LEATHRRILPRKRFKPDKPIGYSAEDISLLQELTRALQAYQPPPTPIEGTQKDRRTNRRCAMKRFPWEVISRAGHWKLA